MHQFFLNYLVNAQNNCKGKVQSLLPILCSSDLFFYPYLSSTITFLMRWQFRKSPNLEKPLCLAPVFLQRRVEKWNSHFSFKLSRVLNYRDMLDCLPIHSSFSLPHQTISQWRDGMNSSQWMKGFRKVD